MLLVLGSYVAAELPQGFWRLLSFNVVALEVVFIVVLFFIRLSVPTSVFFFLLLLISARPSVSLGRLFQFVDFGYWNLFYR